MLVIIEKALMIILLIFISTSCGVQENEKYENNVGFIDPKDALGDKEFKTCGNYIYEYYNSFPHGGFKYGKKALRDSVMRKYKTVSTESGYLTFRFVVNCQGVAGHYEIIENDLNHAPARLNKNVISNLFQITQDLREWKQITLDDQPRDYYFYITYKLNDGKIIGILP
jgi:hypothetical protein